jgi:hypothetical protein
MTPPEVQFWACRPCQCLAPLTREPVDCARIVLFLVGGGRLISGCYGAGGSSASETLPGGCSGGVATPATGLRSQPRPLPQLLNSRTAVAVPVPALLLWLTPVPRRPCDEFTLWHRTIV